MNKFEYNQNMVNFLSKAHSHCMQNVLGHNNGFETLYEQHDEIRSLIGRELTFAAIEAKQERDHALRFNHVLDRTARFELLKRKLNK